MQGEQYTTISAYSDNPKDVGRACISIQADIGERSQQ